MNPILREIATRKSFRTCLLSLAFGLVCLTGIFAQQSSPSFELDVLPLLTKHGCNSGACHGAVAGRGEFYLSLWGSDPKSDYRQIVDAYDSRRIRYNSPHESLLIAKPSGGIAHEGQERFEPDSSTAETLARWIQAGTPYGEPAEVTDFLIYADPKDSLESSSKAMEYRLRSSAKSTRSANYFDVTQKTAWEIDPSSGMNWTDQNNPTIRLDRPGRHLLTARFAGQVRTLVLIAPYAKDPFQHLAQHPSNPGLKSSIPSSASQSQIDQHIGKMLEQANLPAAQGVNELAWLRRASLDLMGRIPTIEEIRDFEKLDPNDRKALSVDRMIQSESFQEYWTYKLARWLGFRPVANEPQATKAFEDYLRKRISERDSWRLIARELLVSTGDSHHIGQVNFARLAADPRAHAELISRVFLGARLGCANCHNHPLDRWTQDDYHGLAAILSGIDRGRQVRHIGGGQVTNLRTKEPATPKLPGGEFLAIQSDTQTSAENIERLCQWILDDRDPKFARVLANRLWATMMGRGLIDPSDDLRETNPASHPELLDHLVRMLIDSDYQPAVVLKAIALSDVYSRGSFASQTMLIDQSFFATHIDKPLGPEVLYDAIEDAMGIAKQTRAIRWIDPTLPNESLDILGRCGRPMACQTPSLGGVQNTSLSVQLHWINGPLLNRAIESPEGFLRRELEQGSTNQRIIELGYLRILSKHPDPEDVRRWIEKVPSDPQLRRAWFEDWAWSLFSSPYFHSN